MLEGLPQLTLNHGLMEFEYTANYTKVQSALHSQPEDVSVSSVVTDPAAIPDDSFRVAMTASMDTCGRLLLGIGSGGPWFSRLCGPFVIWDQLRFTFKMLMCSI